MNPPQVKLALIVGGGIAALAGAVSSCGGDDRYSPRLTPEMVESLAGTEAYDSGSNVAIFCDALGFREKPRTWLVECIQKQTTRWVVDDKTEQVRPADEVTESPTGAEN